MTRRMNIGEAAKVTGVSAKMIRHYEDIGLLPAAARTIAGYRQYSEHDISLLRFIRQARNLGFSIQKISDLVSLWSDRNRASREVKQVAMRHLAELAEKMRQMAEISSALERLVESCSGSEDPHCAILDGLAGEQTPPPDLSRKRQSHVQKSAVRGPTVSRTATGSARTHAEMMMAWTRGVRAGHEED